MMNLYHLRYFWDAAVLGGVTPAANKNKVGRSAISQSIRQLEQTFGAELLVHKKNSFELTAAGKTLSRHCDEIFSAVERVKDKVKNTESDPVGTLSIGASHSMALSVLPPIISDFSKAYPQVECSFQLGNAARVFELLHERSIDIGVAVLDPSEYPDRLEKRLLRKGRFVLVKTAKGKAQDCFLVGDRGLEVSAFKKLHQRLNPKIERHFMAVQSWEVIAAFARQGLGIGLIPDFMLAKEKDLKVVEYPGYSPFYEIYAFFKSETLLSTSARLFLENLSRLKH